VIAIAGCSTTGASGTPVPAVLSAEDAQDILPGPEGNFVVMIHLGSDGSTIPFVMQTPRQATPFAGSLAADEPVFIVDVPGDQTQPLIDAELDWQDAIISSESRLKPGVLTSTADQLVVDARIPGSIMQVDASITTWTQNNPAHMAGAYLIRDEACIAVVARQTSDNDWLLTAIPNWTGMPAVRELSSSPGALILSDSTTLNPSRIEGCQPGS
jgi:hypothetical protein